MPETKTEINCDLCGSAEKILITTENDHPISRCLSCGLIYVNQLSPVEDGRFHGEYYEDDRAEIEVVRKRYADVCKFLVSEIGKYSPVGSLLDVGCGYGFFLVEARKNGWDVFGSDLSEAAVEYAKTEQGLANVYCSDLRSEVFSKLKFNAINMTNVLEHVPNATSILEDCKRLLDEQGVLLIRVPNMEFNDLKRKILPLLRLFRLGKGGDLTYLSSPPPLHLMGFSSKTLRKYFEKTGFKTIEIKPSKLSSSAQENVVFRIFEIFVQLLYRISFRKINLSPTILAIARKV